MVTSNGEALGPTTPVPQANGRALRAVFQHWNTDPALSEAFEAHVADARTIADTTLDSDSHHR